MASRTADGKHTTRFIIEVQGVEDGIWVRSGNDGLTGHFPTREAAQSALDTGYKSEGLVYRIRQK